MTSPNDTLFDKQSASYPTSSPGSLSNSQYADAQSELQSSSNSSYHSVDTQSETTTNAEEDANSILAFIATLDSASDLNVTGWDHANALRALNAKRSRLKSNPNAKSHSSHFDFFSHFDPILRDHLRHAYDRRKRWGFTGDAQQNSSSAFAMMSLPNVQGLVHTIEEAIDTPARESFGQVLRRNAKKDTERENRELDQFDGEFESTWKGVVESRTMAGSVLRSVTRKQVED